MWKKLGAWSLSNPSWSTANDIFLQLVIVQPKMEPNTRKLSLGIILATNELFSNWPLSVFIVLFLISMSGRKLNIICLNKETQYEIEILTQSEVIGSPASFKGTTALISIPLTKYIEHDIIHYHSPKNIYFGPFLRISTAKRWSCLKTHFVSIFFWNK